MDEITRLKFRSIIEFLFKEKVAATDIYNRLTAVYGDEAPSKAMVCNWHNEFKRGRKSIETATKPGRPVEATSNDISEAVEKLVMADRRVKVREIAEELGVSKDSVDRILRYNLGMSKVAARWVPKMLSPVQKADRVEISSQNLAIIDNDEKGFYRCLVTVDETWLHHYDPESKQQSKQWKHFDSPPPLKFRTVASAGKVMATVFWDAEGIIFIDYLAKGRTITGAYYAILLGKLRKALLEKRRGKVTRGVLLLQDNAPVHVAQVAQLALRDNGFKQLPHPAYSPDLAPSDFFLFRTLKDHLRGKKFSHDCEVQMATEAFFNEKPSEWFMDGLCKLKERYEKCIAFSGEYVEKL